MWGRTIFLLFITLLLASTLATPVVAEESQVKIAIKINPRYFNVVITDDEVIQHTKDYLKNATDFKKAQVELLTATLKTVVENPSSLTPVEVLFTQDGVVFEYTYNPKYVYESSTKLVLPEIRLKGALPVSVSKDFITNCQIYNKPNNESCKYSLTNNVNDVEFWKVIPRLSYSKESLTLDRNVISIFVDSSGKVLVIYPDNFPLQLNGECSVKKVSDQSGEYFMYTCNNLNYVDFSSLTPGEYKVYITYNSDNTKVFKIDKLSYKVVTYIRSNVVIKKETLEADQLARLYFERMQGGEEKNNKTLLYAGAGVGVIIIIGVVVYFVRRRGRDEEDIFE